MRLLFTFILAITTITLVFGQSKSVVVEKKNNQQNCA